MSIKRNEQPDYPIRKQYGDLDINLKKYILCYYNIKLMPRARMLLNPPPLSGNTI